MKSIRPLLQQHRRVSAPDSPHRPLAQRQRPLEKYRGKQHGANRHEEQQQKPDESQLRGFGNGFAQSRENEPQAHEKQHAQDAEKGRAPVAQQQKNQARRRRDTRHAEGVFDCGHCGNRGI